MASTVRLYHPYSGGIQPAVWRMFSTLEGNHNSKTLQRLIAIVYKISVQQNLKYLLGSSAKIVFIKIMQNKTYFAYSSIGNLCTSNTLLFDWRKTDLTYDTIL